MCAEHTSFYPLVPFGAVQSGGPSGDRGGGGVGVLGAGEPTGQVRGELKRDEDEG